MRVIIFLLFAGLFFSCGETSTFVLNPDEIKYPESRLMDQVDTLWGVEVEDPYRWLEDDRDPEVVQWVIDQNTTTRNYLDALPLRNELRDRYEKLFNYEKVGIPRKVGDKFFISRNDGLQNQSVTYIYDSIGSEERVFLDPNTLSEDGTVTASLGGASDDGKYISVIKSAAGSDWQEIGVMDVETGRELDDVLKWVKFSGTSWVNDGFYYSRYPEPEESAFSSENTFHSVYFHKIGTLQSEDVLVYIDEKEPNRYHFAWATEDNNYLVLNVSTGTDGNSLLIKDLRTEGSDWRILVDGFTDHSGVVGSVEGKILLLTDIEAPKYRLVVVDPTQELTNTDLWTDIIPQSNHLLESVQVSAGRLFATFLRKACHAVVSYDFMGLDAKEIALPSNVGSVGGFGGKMNSKEVFYAFTSFTHPTSIYKYDPVLHESLLFSAPEVNFKPEAYETKQVEYFSKDGTKIPMFLVHKKGIILNGKNPTLLYAYGGFNISLTPSFSASNIVFLERGGVYAMPNLRGGGEFGEEWHKAGMLLEKQNVFDDFIAAAEYLIDEKYTCSEKLAIEGRSNGGLLIGAVMNQRPELAAVAFPGVGVMDMLRYHKFTIGWGWIPEYGCVDSTEADFKNLYSFSPVHNLVDGVNYPSTMVTTSDHDDRVVPAHSFKFSARLQAAHKGNEPVLIRIELNAGHGAGKPTSKIIDEQADKWAFLFHEMKKL